MSVCVEAPICLFCSHIVLQDSSGIEFPSAKAILVLSQLAVYIYLLTPVTIWCTHHYRSIIILLVENRVHTRCMPA